jgi:hypothetical protein
MERVLEYVFEKDGNDWGTSQLISYKIVSNIIFTRLIPYIKKIIGNVSVDFDVIDLLLIRLSAFVRYYNWAYQKFLWMMEMGTSRSGQVCSPILYF